MTVISPRVCIRRRLGQCLFGIVCLLFCGSIMAQNLPIDTTPPIIELEELVETTADSTQVFTVQIAEETELQNAILFYRRNGEQTYEEAEMNPLGASGFYTVSIATDPDDLRPIEYYLQAKDTSENRTVSGFSFDPYSRSLTPASGQRIDQIAENPESPLEKTQSMVAADPFYKRPWFRVTVGVIAVGLLASSMDSGGEETQIVPVTFNFQE